MMDNQFYADNRITLLLGVLLLAERLCLVERFRDLGWLRETYLLESCDCVRNSRYPFAN